MVPTWRVYSHGRLIATIANMTRVDLRAFFPNAIINVTDHTVIELSWGPV
jgi:maltodextrin utilization protein YvdJ